MLIITIIIIITVIRSICVMLPSLRWIKIFIFFANKQRSTNRADFCACLLIKGIAYAVNTDSSHFFGGVETTVKFSPHLCSLFVGVVDLQTAIERSNHHTMLYQRAKTHTRIQAGPEKVSHCELNNKIILKPVKKEVFIKFEWRISIWTFALALVGIKYSTRHLICDVINYGTWSCDIEKISV